MRYHERMIMLSVLDAHWKDHLRDMDHLKEGIGLRGYGQHDPLVEYKRESFDMFEAMMQRFQEETVRYLYLMQILERPPEPSNQEAPTLGSGGNGHTRPSRPLATSVDDLEEDFQRKKSVSWNRRAWPAGETADQCSRSCVARKSAAMIHAPADQARNTRNATARRR